MKGRTCKGGILLHTVEHREYLVKAKTQSEAFELIKEVNLSPKSKRVELVQFGDFKIVEEEES